MSSPIVMQIQNVLNANGFNCGTADGTPGPKTQAAWKALISSVEGPSGRSEPVPAPIGGESVDARSEAQIATLLPQVQPLARTLIRLAAKEGITAVVTSGNRTYAEQNALYEQGRSTAGKIVTNARGGYSNHNFGLAFDLTIFKNGQPVWESPDYKTLGAIGKEVGLVWGGDWQSISDEPHFELHPSWAQDESEASMLAELRKRHESGISALA